MPLPQRLIIIHHLLIVLPRQVVHRLRPRPLRAAVVLLVVVLVVAGLVDQVGQVVDTEEGTNPNSSPTLF